MKPNEAMLTGEEWKNVLRFNHVSPISVKSYWDTIDDAKHQSLEAWMHNLMIAQPKVASSLYIQALCYDNWQKFDRWKGDTSTEEYIRLLFPYCEMYDEYDAPSRSNQP